MFELRPSGNYPDLRLHKYLFAPFVVFAINPFAPSAAFAIIPNLRPVFVVSQGMRVSAGNEESDHRRDDDDDQDEDEGQPQRSGQ